MPVWSRETARQVCNESRPEGGQAPDQANSGRQAGVAALLGRIIRKARNAASHPTSHKRHDNNQAGNGP